MERRRKGKRWTLLGKLANNLHAKEPLWSWALGVVDLEIFGGRCASMAVARMERIGQALGRLRASMQA